MPVDRIPLTPPVIQPLPAGIDRPRWSVMIPVYNCAAYLKETLAAVLEQALPLEDMQIEVVDDCSTDANVAGLVADIGKGRVQYFRQPYNVGSVRNFETCINRATGHLIHILHGDDLVKPGYYASIQRLFDRFPAIGAAFCRYAYVGESSKPLYVRDPEMDTAGILDNWLLRLAQRQRLQYCTVTVRREVYERLGSFYGVDYGEDWEMWMRIARHYPVAYEPEVLAAYRLHMASISGQSYASARNLKDLQWVIRTIQQYLPESEKEVLYKKAMKFYAHYGLKVANDLWYGLHNKVGAKVQVREALSMHKDALLYWKVTKLYIKMALNITALIPRYKRPID